MNKLELFLALHPHPPCTGTRSYTHCFTRRYDGVADFGCDDCDYIAPVGSVVRMQPNGGGGIGISVFMVSTDEEV